MGQPHGHTHHEGDTDPDMIQPAPRLQDHVHPHRAQQLIHASDVPVT